MFFNDNIPLNLGRDLARTIIFNRPISVSGWLFNSSLYMEYGHDAEK